MEKKGCLDCAYLPLWKEGETVCRCNKHNCDINIIKEDDEEIVLDKEICDDFEEARYVVTEKGILSSVLTDLNIVGDIFDKKVDIAYTVFLETMKDYGFYVEDGAEEKEYTKTDKTPKDIFKSAIRGVFREEDDVLDAAWTLFRKQMEDAKYF